MNIFGERLFMGATLPCETNCKIQVKDEWHYVKDGDLPKTHGWYYVQYNNDTFDCAIVTENLRFLNFYTSKDMTEAVYAWKEIIQPKE